MEDTTAVGSLEGDSDDSKRKPPAKEPRDAPFLIHSRRRDKLEVARGSRKCTLQKTGEDRRVAGEPSGLSRMAVGAVARGLSSAPQSGKSPTRKEPGRKTLDGQGGSGVVGPIRDTIRRKYSRVADSQSCRQVMPVAVRAAENMQLRPRKKYCSDRTIRRQVTKKVIFFLLSVAEVV